MTEPSTPGRASSVAWGASLSLIAALVTAALVPAVIGARLLEGERRVGAGLARVAGSWLAERVAPLPAQRREAFLVEAGRRMGGLAALHDRESGFHHANPLAALMGEEVERLLFRGSGALEIGGEPHQVSVASLRAPLSRLSVVLAIPERAAEPPLTGAMARLLALAALLLAAAAVFGACCGLEFGRGLETLGRRLGAAGGVPPAAGAAPPVAPAELDGIARAVGRLERRLASRAPRRCEAAPAGTSSEDRREKLLTSVARDLHRPLESIVGIAGGLLEGRQGELQPSQREDIAIIRQACGRLLELVDEIIDFTSMMGTDFELNIEAMPLAEVAEEVIRAARGELGNKPVELVLEAGEEPIPSVRGDRRRIWQVLTNLVSNAVKYTDRGSVTVRVAADRDDPGMVRLEVRDTGVGIPAMDQPAVFETFRQIRGRARGRRGAGLGLAVSRRLVELHGGTIAVESAAGQGTCFVVLLPEAP